MIESGLAVGALVVLICTSRAGILIRWPLEKIGLGYLINCCFCTSWWVSLIILDKFSIIDWAAIVAIANFTILLIHMSISTYEDHVV